MKAKNLVCLVALILGTVIGGCKKGKEAEYDFITFKDKQTGAHHIFPTGTDYQIIGIGWDFDCDGTVESVFVQATGEGFNKDNPRGKVYMDKWAAKYKWSQENGRVQYVE